MRYYEIEIWHILWMKKRRKQKKKLIYMRKSNRKNISNKIIKILRRKEAKIKIKRRQKKNGKNILLFLTSDIFKSKKYFTIFIFRFWIFKEFLMWSDLMFHHACIVIFRHCSIDLKFNIFSVLISWEWGLVEWRKRGRAVNIQKNDNDQALR